MTVSIIHLVPCCRPNATANYQAGTTCPNRTWQMKIVRTWTWSACVAHWARKPMCADPIQKPSTIRSVLLLDLLGTMTPTIWKISIYDLIFARPPLHTIDVYPLSLAWCGRWWSWEFLWSVTQKTTWKNNCGWATRQCRTYAVSVWLTCSWYFTLRLSQLGVPSIDG